MGKSYPTNAKGPGQFVRGELYPFCSRMDQEAHHILEIQAQTSGEGVRADRLLTLGRHEKHLNRNFERTLAMLLKLKQIRNG